MNQPDFTEDPAPITLDNKGNLVIGDWDFSDDED